VVARAGDPSICTSSIADAAVERFDWLYRGMMHSVPNANTLLFVARGPLLAFQHNALIRRRGIWGQGELHRLVENLPRSPSLLIEGTDGIYFAGLALITSADLATMVQFARGNYSCVIFVSESSVMTERRVRKIFDLTFPRPSIDGLRVDTRSVLSGIGDGLHIWIRPFGNFDDREVVIDAFMHSSLTDSVIRTICESSSDRGWMKQEMNAIDCGRRSSVRTPPSILVERMARFRSAGGIGSAASPAKLQDVDVHGLREPFDDLAGGWMEQLDR